jgi:hypothetical protein
MSSLEKIGELNEELLPVFRQAVGKDKLAPLRGVNDVKVTLIDIKTYIKS